MRTSDPGVAEALRLYEEEKYEDAAKAAERLALDGNVDAQVLMGWIHQNGRVSPANEEIAIGWYEAAAQKGSANALYALGNLYKSRKDHFSAFKYYREAAAKNHLPSLYNLGLMYESGTGTIANSIEATKCYECAAKKGHVFSQMKVARRLIAGPGVVNKVKGLFLKMKIFFSVIFFVSRDRYDERTYE